MTLTNSSQFTQSWGFEVFFSLSLNFGVAWVGRCGRVKMTPFNAQRGGGHNKRDETVSSFSFSLFFIAFSLSCLTFFSAKRAHSNEFVNSSLRAAHFNFVQQKDQIVYDSSIVSPSQKLFRPLLCHESFHRIEPRKFPLLAGFWRSLQEVNDHNQLKLGLFHLNTLGSGKEKLMLIMTFEKYFTVYFTFVTIISISIKWAFYFIHFCYYLTTMKVARGENERAKVPKKLNFKQFRKLNKNLIQIH